MVLEIKVIMFKEMQFMFNNYIKKVMLYTSVWYNNRENFAMFKGAGHGFDCSFFKIG